MKENVEFRTAEFVGRMTVYTGRVGSQGFNLYHNDEDINVEICDSLGKVWRDAPQSLRDEVKMAFLNR